MPDAQTIGVYVASAAVVVTGLGVADQWRRGRRSEGNDFLWRLVETWESSDIRARRVRVAADLRHDPGLYSRHTLDVFNFFEFLAYLVRSGSVRADGAWNYFSMFALGYWFAGRAEIDRLRRDDDTVYAEYERLVNRFLGMEAKERHMSKAMLSWQPEDVAVFLRNEAELAAVVSPPTLPEPPPPDPATPAASDQRKPQEPTA